MVILFMPSSMIRITDTNCLWYDDSLYEMTKRQPKRESCLMIRRSNGVILTLLLGKEGKEEEDAAGAILGAISITFHVRGVISWRMMSDRHSKVRQSVCSCCVCHCLTSASHHRLASSSFSSLQTSCPHLNNCCPNRNIKVKMIRWDKWISSQMIRWMMMTMADNFLFLTHLNPVSLIYFLWFRIMIWKTSHQNRWNTSIQSGSR